MKTDLNTGLLNIIIDIPEKIEPNEIRLVINSIEYLLIKQKNKGNNIHEFNTNKDTRNNNSINTRNNALLNAIEKLPSGKYKSGDGRKAQWIADQYKICLSTVYQAQKLLRDAPADILHKFRRGEMQIKTAYKLVKKYEKKLEENHSKRKRKKVSL